MKASSPSILRALSPRDTEDESQRRALLAEVDASCRWPVMLLFGCSLAWLLIGTVFALLASWKMHSPDFFGGISWLTFGRVRPAHLNAMVYGFASQAGIAVTLWLMCRLCGTPLICGWLAGLAGVFWNLAVAVGIIGILAGHSTGMEWLEFPAYTTPILFAAFALIALWGIITFRYRREPHLYISQFYLLGALFWFPWLYSMTQVLLVMEPVRGVVQAAVNWWFAHNVLGLWLTPIGLAGVYYFIPKVIGRPVHSYYLSLLGFWSLALFYNWNGMHHLVGGPLPAWLVTVSIVASVMMLIPVVTVGLNHHLTMWCHFH
ncbi:MAG: cbb3-type cytochrome c oxidase subunit I, partial [Kiritimatiellaeota bacterium]|nr:cbb3-type cytochrome c oxidase subunit I [Kiritimatiellota bacterium]